MAQTWVLDTSVMEAALQVAHGASRRLLLAALKGKFNLLLSVPLILQYDEALARRSFLMASGLNAGEVRRVLDDVAAIATPAKLDFLWRPRSSDPDDDMVLETAFKGQAGAIVTLSSPNLVEAARDFRCVVITPARALARLKG